MRGMVDKKAGRRARGRVGRIKQRIRREKDGREQKGEKIKRVDNHLEVNETIKIFQATPESALQALPEKYAYC